MCVCIQRGGRTVDLRSDRPPGAYRLLSSKGSVASGDFGHSYYLTNENVINDMCYVLLGKDPDEIPNRKYQNGRNRYLITAE